MSSGKPLIKYGRRRTIIRPITPEIPRRPTAPLEVEATEPELSRSSRKRRRVAAGSDGESSDAQPVQQSKVARQISKRKPFQASTSVVDSKPNGPLPGFDSPLSSLPTTESEGSPTPAPPPVTPSKPSASTSSTTRFDSFERPLAQQLDQAQLPSTPKSGRAKGMKKRFSALPDQKGAVSFAESASPSPSPVRSTASSPLKPSSSLAAFEFLEATSKSAHTSPSKQQRGLTKRMLSKSKTEPSIPLPPSPLMQINKLSASHSLPVIDRRPTELATASGGTDILASPSPNRPPPPLMHKKTYASSRSFLVPLSNIPVTRNGDVKNESHDDLDEELHRESYIELQSRWGVDASNELEESLLLKSITEMRSKGENRRFLDEMGYLAEGLEEGNSLPIQQGSAVEIIGKMSDMEFMRRAQAADFVEKTWDMIATARGKSDTVLDPALAFYVALVARDAHMLQELANANPSVLPFLLEAAGTREENDVLVANVSTGVSKSERRLLDQLQRIIKRSEVVESPSKLTTALLATQALRILHPPHNEQEVVIEKVSEYLITQLVQSTSLLGELDILEDSYDVYLGGLEVLHNFVSILESVSTSGGSSFDRVLKDHAEDERRGEIALGLLYMSCGDSILRDSGEDRDLYSTSTALRALVNVTNDQPLWCSALLSPAGSLQVVLQLLQWSYREYLPISEEDKNLQNDTESRSRALDRFCLGLGLLTNIIRSEESSKDALRGLVLSVSCTPRKECIRKPTCSKCIGPIPFLVTLYSNHSNKAKKEPTLEDTFLAGHLAVLLGILAESNTSNQRLLLKSLPGSSMADKLDHLIITVEGFAASYGAVVAQLSRLEVSGEGTPDGSTDDSRTVGIEHNVAHGVAISLKKLRGGGR